MFKTLLRSMRKKRQRIKCFSDFKQYVGEATIEESIKKNIPLISLLDDYSRVYFKSYYFHTREITQAILDFRDEFKENLGNEVKSLIKKYISPDSLQERSNKLDRLEARMLDRFSLRPEIYKIADTQLEDLRKLKYFSLELKKVKNLPKYQGKNDCDLYVLNRVRKGLLYQKCVEIHDDFSPEVFSPSKFRSKSEHDDSTLSFELEGTLFEYKDKFKNEVRDLSFQLHDLVEVLIAASPRYKTVLSIDTHRDILEVGIHYATLYHLEKDANDLWRIGQKVVYNYGTEIHRLKDSGTAFQRRQSTLQEGFRYVKKSRSSKEQNSFLKELFRVLDKKEKETFSAAFAHKLMEYLYSNNFDLKIITEDYLKNKLDMVIEDDDRREEFYAKITMSITMTNNYDDLFDDYCLYARGIWGALTPQIEAFPLEHVNVLKSPEALKIFMGKGRNNDW